MSSLFYLYHLVFIGQKDTNTKTELCFSLRLSVCLPPSLPLPLLSCDVFWPDSMAPGRQWHDHRNRGQQGHSSLFGVSRNEPGRSGSASLLTTLSMFSTEDSGLVQAVVSVSSSYSVIWMEFFFFTSYSQIAKSEWIVFMWSFCFRFSA